MEANQLVMVVGDPTGVVSEHISAFHAKSIMHELCSDAVSANVFLAANKDALTSIILDFGLSPDKNVVLGIYGAIRTARRDVKIIVLVEQHHGDVECHFGHDPDLEVKMLN